jgi:hypothetical protein
MDVLRESEIREKVARRYSARTNREKKRKDASMCVWYWL